MLSRRRGPCWLHEPLAVLYRSTEDGCGYWPDYVGAGDLCIYDGLAVSTLAFEGAFKSHVDMCAAVVKEAIVRKFSLCGAAARTCGTALSARPVRRAFASPRVHESWQSIRHVLRASDAFRHLWGAANSPPAAVADALAAFFDSMNCLPDQAGDDVDRDEETSSVASEPLPVPLHDGPHYDVGSILAMG